MNFEKTSKPAQQLKLEKLQGLNHKEKLVLFELAYQLGVTPKKEVSTNFLTQLHLDHLMELYEKWHELDMKAGERGISVSSLSEIEVDDLLSEVLGERN